jgi:CRP-like cAMP-binding protein
VFGDVPAFLGEPEFFDARAARDCTVLSLDADERYHLLQTRLLVAVVAFFASLLNGPETEPLKDGGTVG